MIAFLAPLIAAAAPAVIKGIGGLFKKKNKSADSNQSEASSKKDAETTKVGGDKPDTANIINKVVEGVLSKDGDTHGSDSKTSLAKSDEGKARISLDDLGGVIEKIVSAVKRKLGKNSDDETPKLSRSYAPAENTRLQRAPLASLDRTPIPASTPFLPKGAASLPPLGNVGRI